MTNYSKDRFLRLINEHRSVKNTQPLKEQNIVDDAIDDPMNTEFEDTMECPECGGTAQLIGRLGNRKHYRCESCGLDVSQELDENRWAMSEEAVDEGESCGMGMDMTEATETEETEEKLDEHCGCEEEKHEEMAHAHECPLCGSELMNGECEHHGHMMHGPMEIEAVYEVRKMQRLAGILKEDISDAGDLNVEVVTDDTGSGDPLAESDLSASNDFVNSFDDWE